MYTCTCTYTYCTYMYMYSCTCMHIVFSIIYTYRHVHVHVTYTCTCTIYTSIYNVHVYIIHVYTCTLTRWSFCAIMLVLSWPILTASQRFTGTSRIQNATPAKKASPTCTHMHIAHTHSLTHSHTLIYKPHCHM